MSKAKVVNGKNGFASLGIEQIRWRKRAVYWVEDGGRANSVNRTEDVSTNEFRNENEVAWSAFADPQCLGKRMSRIGKISNIAFGFDAYNATCFLA